MTSAKMFQEFQVLLDKLDTQNLPDIPVEQFFILINVAIDEYMQAARVSFEATRKVSEDVSPLVKRGYIIPIIDKDRTVFSTTKVSLEYPIPNIPSYTPIYYTITGVFEGVWTVKNKEYKGRSELRFYQQDDINISDPFVSKFADNIQVVMENEAIIATPPKELELKLLIGTFLLEPAIVSQLVNCNLSKPIHKTLVKRAVELALENIESIRQKTFNK